MESKERSTKFNIMAIILIMVFCFAVTPITLQNDTFYTIKIGEHIMENGIDMKDPFSWHENMDYTYPHWAYDTGIYLIYNTFGQTGIYISTIILSMLLGIVIYLASRKFTKNNIVSFVLTIGAIYMLKNYIAARAQLPTFILFALTIYFIEMFLETRKKRYGIGLVVIPILIANLHVAVFPFYFILYLPYIGEYILYLIGNSGIALNKYKLKKLQKNVGVDILGDPNIEKIQNRIETLTKRKQKSQENPYKVIITKKENTKYLIIIMIICLLAGLVTPLGTTPYTYLYKTMTGETTNNINEHLPLVLINNINLICALIFFFAILMFTDTKIRLCDLFMFAGLLILTIYSKRQESMFVIGCVFILARLISAMFEKYDPEGCGKLEKIATKLSGQIVTIALILIIATISYKPKMGNKYINEKDYPVEAAEYILNNLDINNIKLYNEYNYGSYLLYKGIPVFIDSRADLYAPEFNENITVFKDFIDMSGLNITNIEEKLNEYGITHLIMYSNAKLKMFIDQTPDKYNELYNDGQFCIYERI